MARTEGLDRTFWLLWASSALCFVSVGAYAPVLPVFVRTELGGGPAEIGLVTGATAAVSILLRPGAGAFGDRRGRRRAAVLGGVLLAAGPLVLVAPGLLAVALLARLLVGLGEALLNVATTAWAFDRAPHVRRARVMGMFSTSIWIGFGVGPQVAELLREAWGFDAVWVWCAATALVAGGLARLIPAPPTHPPEPGPRARLAGPRAALVPGTIVALALLGEGALQAFGVEHLVDRGVAPGGGIGGAASVFTVFAIAALVARVPAGDLVDRRGSHGPAFGALLLVAAGWTLMSDGVELRRGGSGRRARRRGHLGPVPGAEPGRHRPRPRAVARGGARRLHRLHGRRPGTRCGGRRAARPRDLDPGPVRRRRGRIAPGRGR